MTFFDYFDKVYIINLKRRADRRGEVSREFKRLGVEIDNNRIVFFEAVEPSERNGFPSIGCRGCFESHLSILRECLREKYKRILILEDDLAFSKKLKSAGSKSIEDLDGLNWDIAYFGHSIKNKKAAFEWERMNSPILTTHFYAVNASVVEDLILFLEELKVRPAGDPHGGPMHYDGALNTFYKKVNPKVFYYTYNLGYQRPSKTDLHAVSRYENILFVKPIISLYRKIKGAILFIKS